MAQAPLQVGHVALNVRNLNQSETFYTDVVGLEIAARSEGATFFTCGTLHHDLVLFQTQQPADEDIQPAIGLNHIAFQLPDRTALRARYDLLQEQGIPVRTTEHNATLSVYFHDPDGNRIELYCDRYDNGLEVMRTKGPMARPMDIEQLQQL
jgi:catechol 2,3-dioxygenase